MLLCVAKPTHELFKVIHKKQTFAHSSIWKNLLGGCLFFVFFFLVCMLWLLLCFTFVCLVLWFRIVRAENDCFRNKLVLFYSYF